MAAVSRCDHRACPVIGETRKVLDLNDAHWATLHQAYGSAKTIPPLLRALESNPFIRHESAGGNVWFELWSALCHQGTIYTASYAAVPHIVRIAWKAIAVPSRDMPFEFFQLPASIDLERQRSTDAPAVPTTLARAYHESMAELHDLAHAVRLRPWSSELARSIAAALMIERGELDYSELLDWTTDEVRYAKHLLSAHSQSSGNTPPKKATSLDAPD
jgi:hypothetical protein